MHPKSSNPRGEPRPCNLCGATYRPFRSALAAGRGLYCSLSCASKSRAVPPLERFASYAPLPIGDGCCEWQGNRNNWGYGRLDIPGRGTVSAHVLAWEIASGQPVPAGLAVLHTCDNRPCVRADDVGVYMLDGIAKPRRGHLFLGTIAENMYDMWSKGRGATGDRNGNRLHPERTARGEHQWKAKLTALQVAAILARHAAGTDGTVALATEYGVSRTTIRRIVRRETWRHVNSPSGRPIPAA